jgi:hypothetical protein
MISLMVFTIGALGLLTMIYSSHQGVTTAEDLTHATALARSKLDELLRLPYDHTDLDTANTHEEATNIDATGAAVSGSGFGDDDGNYARSWDVLQPDSGEDFKTIAVRVRWWDKNYDLERDVVLRGGKGL